MNLDLWIDGDLQLMGEGARHDQAALCHLASETQKHTWETWTIFLIKNIKVRLQILNQKAKTGMKIWGTK